MTWIDEDYYYMQYSIIKPSFKEIKRVVFNKEDKFIFEAIINIEI